MQNIFYFETAVPSLTKFSVGAPLPKGRFFVTQNLSLFNAQKEAQKVSIKAIQLWPDNSIKWIHFEGVLAQSANANELFYLAVQDTQKAICRDDWVSKKEDKLVIQTKMGAVSVSLKQFLNINCINELETTFDCNIRDMNTRICNTQTQFEVIFDHQNRPLMCKVHQHAYVYAGSDEIARVSCKITSYFADAQTDIEYSLHNPRPIEQEGGQWDLGNRNSMYVDAMAIDFAYRAKKLAAINVSNSDVSCDSFELIQFSSGGNNWSSENHKDRENKVSLTHKGAKLTYESQNDLVSIDIERPEISVFAELSESQLLIQPLNFWQKFPNGLNASLSKTRLDNAEKKSFCEVELQPGEIKSHGVKLIFSDIKSEISPSRNPQINLALENLNESKAVPFFSQSLKEHPLQTVVDPKSNAGNKDSKDHIEQVDWFAKREKLDEYGWRNFGDIYADHEAANYSGSGTFVSHYNNQYDPLYGFLKQWMLTGNHEFKTLADELYDHIVNIDIYHTLDDKPEYNKGLFWHTDHYVAAETATHRTYSKHQPTNVYMDHAGGGGPGAHHCYSSGIALYYLLTGNKQAIDVVSGLRSWMSSIYEGDGSLLGLILRAKNANHLKKPFSDSLLLGEGTGIVRNIFTNAYPLDRGTGNYVNTLLDCFEITQSVKFLEQAEYVILNTISHKDDITKRNFADIENTWFYVVFLQAVCKYLVVISQRLNNNEEMSAITALIKRAFIHYAAWMAEHEQDYLANADVLEYPNDTWTGQDLRKIHVLLFAHALTDNEKMMNKANKMIDKIYPKLKSSEERVYTRIQALILQNFVDKAAIKNSFQCDLKVSNAINGQTKINPSFIKRFGRFFKHYSIKSELRLLAIRIPKLKKVIKF